MQGHYKNQRPCCECRLVYRATSDACTPPCCCALDMSSSPPPATLAFVIEPHHGRPNEDPHCWHQTMTPAKNPCLRCKFARSTGGPQRGGARHHGASRRRRDRSPHRSGSGGGLPGVSPTRSSPDALRTPRTGSSTRSPGSSTWSHRHQSGGGREASSDIYRRALVSSGMLLRPCRQ